MGTDDKRAAGTYWAIESAVTILHCRRFVREFIPERKLRDRRDVSRYFRRVLIRNSLMGGGGYGERA